MIRIASIYPSLLGTYGDGGNVLVLRHRARLHGLAVEVIDIAPGDHVPREADLYVLGGGEDTAQVAAATGLRADGGLAAAAERGAPILAICAGYQLLGRTFPDATGQPAPGLDLIDIWTRRLPSRAVGELAADPVPGSPVSQRLTGYENHAGQTFRGPRVAPLSAVLRGVGNGDGTEGSVSGRVIGTYLHGPCLARNPELADRLLGWVAGRELESVPEPEVQALRAERLRTVLG